MSKMLRFAQKGQEGTIWDLFFILSQSKPCHITDSKILDILDECYMMKGEEMQPLPLREEEKMFKR